MIIYQRSAGARFSFGVSLTALLLEHSKATGSPVGYLGSDDFVLCLPDDKEQQLAIISHLQTCVNDYRQGVTSFLSFGVCPVAEHPDADAQTLINQRIKLKPPEE